MATSPKPKTKQAVTTQDRWLFHDAEGKILGRLATGITIQLMGKDLPTYDPAYDFPTHVVVTNARSIRITGRKEQDKQYHRHTRYPGGLKQESLGDLRERRPTEIIRRAVYGMLPKNRLRDKRIARLHIYPNAEHAHQAQQPV